MRLCNDVVFLVLLHINLNDTSWLYCAAGIQNAGVAAKWPCLRHGRTASSRGYQLAKPMFPGRTICSRIVTHCAALVDRSVVRPNGLILFDYSFAPIILKMKSAICILTYLNFCLKRTHWGIFACSCDAVAFICCKSHAKRMDVDAAGILRKGLSAKL